MVNHNLIFNACRETGDHGPINSWDRQPFITEIADGKTPSYDAALSHVTNNFIWGNYGSSQGFDTDDGSSWYNISDNFMWQVRLSPLPSRLLHAVVEPVVERALYASAGGRLPDAH
jgi:hypothetical protein